MKICHLTSVHNRFDIRIFHKECMSLSKYGFPVSLIVCDGKGDQCVEGISIFDVGKEKGRLRRILLSPQRIFKKAIELNAEIYHVHDPELLPIAIRLKKYGKKVIFDAHEDFPKQLLGKPYLNAISRKVLSFFAEHYEKYATSQLDAIVAATPHIENKFISFGVTAINVNNYPLKKELSSGSFTWVHSDKRSVAYVGGLSLIRGAEQMISALGFVKSDVKLEIAGAFSDKKLENNIRTKKGWSSVISLGFIERKYVSELLKRSFCGLVTFLPSPNHYDSQPNKMFEYMSAGVPVIGSNFSLWKDVIEGNECGVCVDPSNPESIAHAIDYLYDNPSLAEQMGRNGYDAVQNKYNWDIEESKLVDLYKSL